MDVELAPDSSQVAKVPHKSSSDIRILQELKSETADKSETEKEAKEEQNPMILSVNPPDPLVDPPPPAVETISDTMVPDTELTQFWIEGNNEVHKVGLTFPDKNDIMNGWWVSDRVIDASCQMIQFQYHAAGLQSCLYTQSPEHFYKISGEWIQIVNTSPNEGSHWVVLSTYGVDNTEKATPTIFVYDSLWTGNTSDSMMQSISAIMHSPTSIDKFDIQHMKCDRQPNYRDCGIHAIANVVSILNRTDPAHICYLDSEPLRDHLIYCLEAKTFTLFPSVSFDEDYDVVHTQSIVQTPVLKKVPPKEEDNFKA